MGGRFSWDRADTSRSKMNVSLQTGEQGAILMELLLVLCLSLVILGILQQLTGLVYDAHINQQNQAELQYSARMALDCIQRDIRCARNFQVSADGSKLTITDAEGKRIRIFVQNRNLYRQDGSSSPVAENLASVNFRKSVSTLQGKLELEDTNSNYCLDFFCFARALKAQDEGM